MKEYSFLFDLARVLVFPRDISYRRDLNPLYSKKFTNSKSEFDEFFIFNDTLLNYLYELAGGYKVYMYTSGTMQKDHAIQVKISGIFSEIFSASQLSLPKTSPDSYLEIARSINSEPAKIIFVDDNRKNIEAARKAGIIALQFRNNTDLFSRIDKLIKL